MKKEFILDEGKVSQIINEKDIMSGIDHPFLVNLYWTFQSATELYMIMELCVGGEMAFHLH